MSEVTSHPATPAIPGDVVPPNMTPAADSFAHDQALAAARCAVAEYLRDVGLRDPDQVARESRRIVAQALARMPAGAAVSDVSLSQAAVTLTVRRVEHLLAALASAPDNDNASDGLGQVLGARLPDLLDRYSQALKAKRSPGEAVEALRGDARPVVPKSKPSQMRPQRLPLLPALWNRWRTQTVEPTAVEPAAAVPEGERLSRPRVILALLTLVSTLLATWTFGRIVAADGLGLLDVALVALYAVLFVWVAFSFWTATLGLWALLRKQPAQSPTTATEKGDLPPTAILMPVYNEDPTPVFANLRAIIESLQATKCAAPFHLFVLSDTTNPEIWLEEERAWARLVAALPDSVRVFYRHRAKNTSRKAGNIADFCSRWGEHYKYMIVLDADSVMSGETLVALVRRMEADAEIGILQAPPTPVNRQSFFARMQQFASRVYGPVFLEGFALWSQCDGNYWGHNAIIRIRPFMEHCDLPVLPGDGPLGGEILSHDFVEAALMRRAGYKVCLAHDLDGSYEECPTTMLDFAARDQRWCQGNMQHIRLLLAEGLHPASRLHLGMGAMSYLASPLWLAFLVLTLVAAFFGGQVIVDGARPASGLWLFALTMAMLLSPKLWGVIALWRQRREQPAHGAWDRALGGVLLETLVSMLIAPIMMLLHTRFVIATLTGQKVKWNAQQRDDRGVSLADAFAVHYHHTLFGLAIGGLVWLLQPGLLPWLSPILAGLLLAIPLSMLLGSSAVGRALARAKLLLIPEEVAPPPVLVAQRTALDQAKRDSAYITQRPEPFVAAVRDPAFFALHMGVLRATGGEVPIAAEAWRHVCERLKSEGLAAIPAELRRAVLNDPRALETLHIHSRSQLPPPPSVLVS